MKKNKIVTLLGLFIIGFIAVIVSVEALTFDSKAKLLELNLKQSEIAGQIEEIIKEEEYPSYFGGVYVSEDSSYVVLQVVREQLPIEKSSKNYTTYSKIANMDSNIKIEYVKYSHKELNDINDKLVEYFSSEKADLSNLVAHYVDTFNNVVVVELKDNNLKSIEKFKSTAFSDDVVKKTSLKSDILIFTKGIEHETEAMKPGQGITTKGVANNCTMGYRVKINGKQGYLTSGHCFDGNGESSTGGTVKRWKRGGTVDAAFVETSWWTNTFNAPSNSLMHTSGSITTLNNNLCPILSLNMAIAKSGNKTGYTVGQIKNLNYSGNYGGYYQTGLIATNYDSTGGDSGSPVFVPSNVNGGAPLAGLHIGTSSYGKAFVNADEIFLAFGYERY